jgi:cytoplasmic iron level regulating protein YaaA (DUF328/UPF0246 family)
MLILLSPAKTLDYENPGYPSTHSPRFLEKSQKIIDTLRQLSKDEIMQMMSISETLAKVNKDRYQNFHYPLSKNQGKSAIHAFKGDVYQGLAVEDFDEHELKEANRRIRILSGLYGLLRPLDLILPYRLEMGTPLALNGHKNLYEFWGDKITDMINIDAKSENHEWVINLASNEYFKSVKTEKLTLPILTLRFLEMRNGQLKTISFNAKKARGEMARAILLENISEPVALKNISVSDYVFSPKHSTQLEYIYLKE